MEKPKASDVAWKILKGFRLTKEEFEVAKRQKYFVGDISYEDFIALYYEDDEKQGYLCNSEWKQVLPDGSVRYCMWGIHKEQVKEEYLTLVQKAFLGLATLDDVVKMKKEELLEEIVGVLELAERPITGLEISRRIFIRYFGEEWHKHEGAHDKFRRLGMRITQLLGMKEHGERNRRKYGIGFWVSDMANHPLEFYLAKAFRK